MAKRRCYLTAAEVAALHERLARRLDSMGLETQPEVAARILQLTEGDPGVRDFATVIRDDPALSARLIKIANSALYAQREPVTTVERACTVLGTRHLRTASLSFCLARDDADSELRRNSTGVWSLSIFRALLASELAREVAPALASEAFLVGLVLDSGVVTMHRLLGHDHLPMASYWESPERYHLEETRRLEYGHVDIMAVLVERWKFPQLIARPIVLHHTRPVGSKSGAADVLHRIAYVAGQAAGTQDGLPRSARDCERVARTIFPGASGAGVAAAVDRAIAMHAGIRRDYDDIRGGLGDATRLAQFVEHRFQLSLDEILEGSLSRPQPARPVSLLVGDSRVEVEMLRDGRMVAYLTDSLGDRIASHHINPARDTGASISRILGLAPVEGDQLDLLDALIKSPAA